MNLVHLRFNQIAHGALSVPSLTAGPTEFKERVVVLMFTEQRLTKGLLNRVGRRHLLNILIGAFDVFCDSTTFPRVNTAVSRQSL